MDKNNTDIELRKLLNNNDISDLDMEKFPYSKLVQKKEKAIELLCNKLSKPEDSENRKIVQKNLIKSIFENCEKKNFALDEPYTIEEIEDFERRYSIAYNIEQFKIYEELREYLLKVSKTFHIYLACEKVTFSLKIYVSDDDDEDKHYFFLGRKGCGCYFDDYLMNIITGDIRHLIDECDYIIKYNFKDFIYTRF
jgi:hypothetical protein